MARERLAFFKNFKSEEVFWDREFGSTAMEWVTGFNMLTAGYKVIIRATGILAVSCMWPSWGVLLFAKWFWRLWIGGKILVEEMSTIRRNQNAVLGAVKASMQHEDICLHSRSTGEQHAFDLCKQHLQLDRKSWHWLLCRNSRVVESGTEQGCIPGGFQGDSAPKRGCQALVFPVYFAA